MRRALRSVAKKMFHRIAPPEVVAAVRHMRSGNAPVFLVRNVVVTDSVDPVKVLILAPHPDDEAIGAGGVLSMHLAAGSDCTVLYVTDGGGLDSPHDELIRVRRAEAESVGQEFGFRQVFWDKPDTRLTNDRDTVREMAELLSELKPAIVYIPSFFETHFDHFATNHILAEALERLPAVDMTIAGYEVWNNLPFPNYILDICGYVEQKKEMVRHYKTPLATADFIRLLSSRAALHHMLYVSSTDEGFAEAMVRLDAKEWATTYRSYVVMLRENRSPLLDRLQL